MDVTALLRGVGAVAHTLGAGFVMLRKSGKLPPTADGIPPLMQTYAMEYGTSELSLSPHVSFGTGANVLLVDDLIATGGSTIAAASLLRRAKAYVVEVAVLVELVSEPLHGRQQLLQVTGLDLFAVLMF